MNKINKMNKMNPYFIKCLKFTDNITSIELKFGLDGINRLSFNYINCGFKKFTTVHREDLDYYLEKRNAHEKIHHYSFKGAL